MSGRHYIHETVVVVTRLQDFNLHNSVLVFWVPYLNYIGLLYAICLSSKRTPESYFRPTNSKSYLHNLFSGGPPKLRKMSFFSLILRNIPNSITPQTPSAGYEPRSDCLYLLTFFFLQQLALNVHVKHSDLT